MFFFKLYFNINNFKLYSKNKKWINENHVQIQMVEVGQLSFRISNILNLKAKMNYYTRNIILSEVYYIIILLTLR